IKDADKVLDDIEAIIEDESGEVNLLTPEFDSLTYTGYSVELDYEFDSLLIRYASDLNTALLVLPDNTTIEGENKSFTVENIEVGTHLYKIRVVTASGAIEDYEISITRNEPDTDATLKELTYNGTAVPGFTAGMESDEFEIFIKAEEEVYFTAVPTKTTTSVDNTYDSSNPASLSIGENSFTITTLAQDGETSCTYVVKVIKDAPLTLDSLEAIVDTDNRITNFNPENYHYAVDLAYSEQAATIVYSTSYADYNTICFIDAEGNEIDNDTTTLSLENIEVGTFTYKIRITAYSGEYAEYEVALTRDPGSDDNTILSFKYKVNEEDTELTELNINATDTQYSYLVGRDMDIFNPTIVLSDSKASYMMPVDTALISGQSNVKEIVVTSENGKERVYTFTVYPCDTDSIVDMISLLTSSDGTNVLGIDGVSYIDFSNNVLSLTVPNAVNSAYLNVEGGGINSEIYVNGTSFTSSMVTLAEGQNTFEIYIKSEYAIVNPLATDAQSQVYTLNIERVVDPTITIKTTGKNGGDTTEEEVIPYGSDKTYDIAENGYTVLSFKIDGVAQEIVDSYDFTNITSNHVIEIEYEPLTYTITVTVTAGQGGVYIGEEKVESKITYTFGQEFVFTFIPDEGYKLKGINVDGVAFPITSTTLTAGREGDHAFAVSFELIKYQVSLSVIGGHGKITPETATEIGHGFSQSYTFVPDEGYQIKEVKIDDVSYGILPSYTLSNVKANHRISVEFEIKKYTIDVTGDLTNGTVLPGTSLEYEHGSSATYTLTPNQGYHIALLSIDGTVIEGLALENIIQDGYTFDNITGEHTIVVNFEINTYTITVTQTINGTISEAEEYYEYGTDATFTITPLDGCKIVQLIVDGNPVDANTTYTFESISQDHTLSAIFKGEDSSYKVYHHFQNLDGQTYADAVLVSEEQALVNDVIKYLVPTFAGFTAQPVRELTVQPNHVSEIHVYFDRLSYILSFGDTTGTTSTIGAGTYFYGEQVTVVADILTGYRWGGFISNDEALLPSSEDNPYTFNMPAGNIEFTLNLTQYYIIDIQPTKYGILSIEAGSHEFDAGEDLTITYEPYTGYKIKDIKIDGRSLTSYNEESYTFSNIRANHTFFIEFEQIMFNIYTSITGNGNASFDQVQRIPYGSRHVFTIAPQNGYEIINVNIDGQAMGPIEEYIFDEILEDHEIEIQIQQIILRIRVNVIGNGTINPSGDAYVTYGSDKILTFTPDMGYYVKNVKIDNRDLGELSNYIFETVTNDHQVEVEFEQITYTIIHNN
ncbi:MAG: hypothetical protein K2J85_05285, partial [Anaeroplasmataceae bacterium]|nr:hypothetical protein [Anaeroplasmataceae bacterium]